MSGRGRGGRGGGRGGRRPYPEQFGQYFRPIRTGTEQPPTRPKPSSNVPDGVIPDAFGEGGNDQYRAFMSTLGADQPKESRARRGRSTTAGAASASASYTPAQDRLTGANGGSGNTGPTLTQEEKDRRYKETQQRLARLATIESGAFGEKPRRRPAVGGEEEMEVGAGLEGEAPAADEV